MFDFKFDWNDSFNVGIESIDNQHKELLRIGRGIEQLLITNCIGVQTDELLSIVRELREYVSYHFYEEEKFMKYYDYSAFNHHIAEHKQFLKKIEGINMPRLRDYPNEELRKIKSDIQDYIFQHVLQEDKSMVYEINKHK